MDPTQSPYLQGLFAPVDGEVTAERLPVRGELPEGLAGSFVRNGPNPRFAPLGRYHWFDGDGMIHGVTLGERGVSYRSRFIRTRGFAREEAAGRALWGGIMTPIQANPPEGAPLKNTANTDLVFHRGKLLALWWLGDQPWEVSLPDLATVGACRVGEPSDGVATGVAAHAKVDPVTGEMMFMDYSAVRPPWLRYGVLSADGRLRVVPIDLPGPRLLHDLAITERHTILLDFPLLWDREALRHGKRRVAFDTRLPSRFGVIPRHGDGSEIRWFEAPPCYMYHTINAYEDGDEIVLTGCRIENPVPGGRPTDTAVASLDIILLVPFMHRWRIHLRTGAVREEQLDDVASEFPRMDNRRLGRPSRYSYNPRIAPRSELLFDGVIKYDAQTGRSETCAWGALGYGGEVVFAPRPGGTAEDDGWLLTFTTDEGGHSELVVLDAREVARGPIAQVTVPGRVPIGFHAAWVPDPDSGRPS